MEKKRSVNGFGIWFCIFISAITLVLYGCGKDKGVCVSLTGNIIRESRPVTYFNQIDIQDNVNVILVDDTAWHVIVECGSYLAGGIVTQVTDGLLTLGNNNKCNWLRDYSSPVNVYVPARHLWRINYNSAGNVTSAYQVRLDSLKIDVWGGCGLIDLDVNLNLRGTFSMNLGTADIKLRGTCKESNIYSGAFGMFDGRNMKTKWTHIKSASSNDCYVRVEKSPPEYSTLLRVRILSVGNIYYTGDVPQDSIKLDSMTGTGQLIRF